MSPPSPLAGRLLAGSAACALHMAAIVCIGAAFTAEKEVQGGAPVIHVTLEGHGFAGEASLQQPPRTARAEKQDRPSSEPATTPLQKTNSSSRQAPPLAARVSESISSFSTSSALPVGAPPRFSAAISADVASASQATRASVASPSPGAGAPLKGASGDQASDPYEAQVIAWLEQHKRHPGGVAGRILVRFTLDRRGRLLTSSIVSGDGERRLERIALSQLQEAAPFPRPPSDTSWRTRSFVVRLDYRSDQA